MKDNIGLRMQKLTPRLVHIATDDLIVLVSLKQHKVIIVVTMGCYAIVEPLPGGLSIRANAKDAFLPWEYLEALPVSKEEEP